jgi:hypothetical protein
MTTPTPGTDEWSTHWAEVIRKAQTETTATVAGAVYERVRYGGEYKHGFAYKPKCWDCAVAIGELHVAKCSVERCPRCMGQRIECSCTELH